MNKLLTLPDRLLSSINKKTASTKSKLSRKTESYLTKLERKEKRLYRKAFSKDSFLAKQSFGNIDSVYDALRNATSAKGPYSGHLDSMTTAFNFLKSKGASGSLLDKNLASCEALKEQMNVSDKIRKELEARRKLLSSKLGQIGMINDLKGIQKDLYYYNAQLKEYKAVFEDPKKLEEKLLALAMKMDGFKKFFRSNSQLGSLFALPGDNPATQTSLQGLQTRASVSQLLASRFGNTAASTAMLQQNMQAAQVQLTQLQNQFLSLTSGSGGSGDPSMPDFKPNTQKTKSFFKRLELGANMQSQKSRSYFPVTSEIGLSAGYRLNDKSVIGLGISYKLGLGRGWDHFSLTHQGVGLRSYLDFQLKAGLYLSGGYEKNHLSQFKSIQQLKDYSAWQSSGLIGLSKRYKAGKKLKGEMKLLWDFLSYQQVPRTQAIVFRIGYKIK